MHSPDMKLKLAAGVISMAMLSACGGGGGGSTTEPLTQPTNPAPAPVPATSEVIVKRGAITGFGSVFVNGERFETGSETEYTKDDNSSLEDDLKVGMIVRVKSREKNAAGEWIAERVEFDEDVKGPLDDIQGNRLTVMGQTVNYIDGETRIDDGLTLGDLAMGDILEISGHRVEGGEIDALYIERKQLIDVDGYEVLGRIENLDTAAQTFTIGGLTVDYGVVPAELDDLDSGLADGLLVEVEDSNKAYIAGDLLVNATEVEGENRFEFKDEDDNDTDEDEDELEIEGIISEIVNDTSFMLGDTLVSHNPATTEYEYGDVTDLVVGAEVEVEGDMTGEGVSADEIKFERNRSGVAGLVSEVNVDTGEITIMDIVVETGEFTEFEDDFGENEMLMIGDLLPGDYLEVRGAQVESQNRLRAEKVELDDADDDSELRGVVQGFNSTARTVTLFGQLIITDADTQYEDDDGESDDVDDNIGAEAFFARLHDNQTVVKAKWDGAVADTLLPVKELSLED